MDGLRVGRPGPEHAGELLTVQRAAYVTEAQRYHAPHIPPLTETLDEVRADLVDPGGVGEPVERVGSAPGASGLPSR